MSEYAGRETSVLALALKVARRWGWGTRKRDGNMKKAVLSFFVLLGIAALAVDGQGWHDEQYLSGCYPNGPSTTPSQAPGIWIVRANGSSSLAALSQYFSTGFCMDVDNKHVVVACQGAPGYNGPGYGIYRFDPKTLLYTTIYGPDTMACNNVYNLHVNQDGDYIFNGSISGSQTDFRVMKVDQSRKLTTVLTSQMIGRDAYLCGKMTTNIDTGNLLVFDKMRIPPDHIFEVEPNGAVTTFNTGSNGSNAWYFDFSLTQNHRNGYIEGPNVIQVYRVKPGNFPWTKLHTLTQIPFLLLNAGLDLQTGSQMRWVCTGGYTNATWLIWIDYKTGTVTNVQLNSRAIGNHDIAFYRGNHIQTLKVAPHKWSILLSCPRSPGYSYVLAAGISGVRPGIQLGSGRHLNLNLDPLVIASVHNRLPGIWAPGSGTLNALGEARGTVNVAGLNPPPGGFGIPIWIAMIVLDPKAPGGIKYIPDTYVMRL